MTIEDLRPVIHVVFWSARTAAGSRQRVTHYRSRGDGAGEAVVNVGSLFGNRVTRR